MTIDQLIYFSDAFETRSFTKTSKKYYISQPAISDAIKKLEKELNCELFIRNNNELIITPNGEFFYSLVKPIVDSFLSLNENMKNHINNSYSLKAGIPPMLGSFVFAPIFDKIHQEYPLIKITMIELGSKANQQALLDGTVDITLTLIYNNNYDKNIEYIKLSETNLLFVVNKNHPLARRNKVSLRDISTVPLILLREDSLQYQVVNSLFKEMNLVPNIRILLDQIYTIKELIKFGDLGALLFKEVVKDDENLKAIPLDEPIKFDIVIAWKKNRTINEHQQKIINFIVKNCKTMQ